MTSATTPPAAFTATGRRPTDGPGRPAPAPVGSPERREGRMKPWHLREFHPEDLDQLVEVWQESRKPGKPAVYSLSEHVRRRDGLLYFERVVPVQRQEIGPLSQLGGRVLPRGLSG